MHSVVTAVGNHASRKHANLVGSACSLNSMCDLQVFAKCGVIKEDDERRPRVKVYRDRESGMPKGDGLVTYLKDPSVHPFYLYVVEAPCELPQPV